MRPTMVHGGSIIMISFEQGIGKTRHAHELVDTTHTLHEESS